MHEAIVYLNGQMVPASRAHLAVYDAGVVMGATVSELTRTFHHRLFRLDDHLDRLFRSLESTRMAIGLGKEELARISQELVAHNAPLLHEGEELGLIHFVTAGEYPTYASMSGRPARTEPTMYAHTFPLPFELWAAKMQAGAHVVIPSTRQVPPQCWPPAIKCRSRMHYYLAGKEAQLVDPDAIALLVDLAGNVTETNGANFLIVMKGSIISPPPDKVLPGISRATVIELARKLGIPFIEKDFQLDAVMAANEAFLASTPYCLMPVTKINGTVLGEGKPGRIYQRLLEAWSESVGVDIAAQIVDGARRRR